MFRLFLFSCFLIFFCFSLFFAYTNTIPLTIQTTICLLWTVSLSGFLFSLYATYPWLHGRPYSPVISALIYPTTLLTWTFGLTLAIWLCVTNNGGIIGTFLSYFQFRPLSRMTYSVYLTHVWIVWTSNGSRRDLIDLNTQSMIIYCGGIILCSYFVGFLFTVLFESPLINGLEYWKHRILVMKRNNRREQRRRNNTDSTGNTSINFELPQQLQQVNFNKNLTQV